jgi:hypothetical protein
MGIRLFRKKKKTDDKGEAVHKAPPHQPPQVTRTTSTGNYQTSYPPSTPPPSSTKKSSSSSRDVEVSPTNDNNNNKDISTKKGYFCKTRFFHNMCQSAFQVVDADGSGDVDEKELYSGLLLIHLKLGTYAGPAACKVGKRHDLF